MTAMGVVNVLGDPDMDVLIYRLFTDHGATGNVCSGA